jgi:hypothetical protein
VGSPLVLGRRLPEPVRPDSVEEDVQLNVATGWALLPGDSRSTPSEPAVTGCSPAGPVQVRVWSAIDASCLLRQRLSYPRINLRVEPRPSTQSLIA